LSVGKAPENRRSAGADFRGLLRRYAAGLYIFYESGMLPQNGALSVWSAVTQEESV
jgi:hypothetical protein